MVDKQRKLPELLAPAGDMERLKMAVLYGADAVYLAGTDFGMRATMYGSTAPSTPCPGGMRSSACRRIWNG